MNSRCRQQALIAGAVLGGLVLRSLWKRWTQRPTGPIAPVLITGCDTGFGNLLARDLAKDGWEVFAGCFTAQGCDALNKVDNVFAFRLDVGSEESVKAAGELIRSKTSTLHAIVNNAGISDGWLMDLTSLARFRHTFEINLLGVISVTKTFWRLCGASDNGRIVNIASVAGRVAGPGGSGYSASKFAVEGFSDAIRRELAGFGVRVCIVEPGCFRTNIWDAIGAVKQIVADNPKESLDIYGPEFIAQHTDVDFIKNKLEGLMQDPEKVVRALRHAVTSRRPNTRYSVGWDAKVLFLPLAYAPTWLSDALWRKLLQAGAVRPVGFKK